VSYFTSHRRGPHFAQDWSCLPARAAHTIFCLAYAFIDHGKGSAGSMQQLDHYSTTTIFHVINDLVLFSLSVTHAGYNMNIRCNQKCMSCKNHGIESVSGCAYHLALLGIPTLPPAGRKKDAFQRFNCYRKPNFQYRRDKKKYCSIILTNNNFDRYIKKCLNIIVY